MTTDRERWKLQNFFRNYGVGPEHIKPLQNRTSHNAVIVHPADTFAQTFDCQSWGELILKMKGGYIATGYIPVRPSKSSWGLTLFTQSLMREKDLIYYMNEDFLGLITIGFREYFPAEVLEAYDAKVDKALAKALLTSTGRVANPDPEIQDFPHEYADRYKDQGDASKALTNLLDISTHETRVHDSVFSKNPERGFAENLIAISANSGGGQSFVKGTGGSTYPSLQSIPKNKFNRKFFKGKK